MTSNGYEDWIVEDDFNNTRVDYFLKKKLKDFSYPSVCQIIRKGLIKVNDKKVKNNHILSNRDNIKLLKGLIKNESVKGSFHDKFKFKKLLDECLIYNDNNYLAINKPPGLAVQGGSKISNSIDKILEGFTDDFEEKPRLVHRLDKSTSGVLIFAKNLNSASFICDLFKERKINKTYLAVVDGSLKIKQSDITFPIFDGKKKLEAITDYEVVEEKNNFSLLMIIPKTGRKNQIRKHFYLLKKPILGDSKFILEKDSFKKSHSRLYLHSYKTEFVDQENKIISIKAKIPKYFEQFLKRNSFKKILNL